MAATCILFLGGVVACSEDFTSCQDTYTCTGADGAGNEAGETGTTGAAGAGGETPSTGGSSANSSNGSGANAGSDAGSDGSKGGSSSASSGGTGGGANQCDNDSDCDDGRYCNGEETCGDGTCVAGQPACANTDPEHCAVACEEGDGEAQCVVTARDSDGDGFASAKCVDAVEPGRDCDDTDEDVNPDADEVCDAIDNDCDGAIDVMDGIPLAGGVHEIPDAVEVDVDWSPVSETFGVAYEMNQGISFSTLLETSIVTGTVPVVASMAYVYFGARIAWGTDAWGVVYGSTDQGRHFDRVDAAGNPVGPASVAASGSPAVNDVAWRSLGDWILVRSGGDGTLVSELVVPGTPDSFAAGVSFTTPVSTPRLATNENETAVVWQLDAAGGIAWSRISEALEASDPEPLATDGQLPRITAIPDGYAITWATDAGFSYEARALDGSSLCGPVDIEFGDGTLDANDEATPRHTEYGTLVVAVDEGSDAVSLFRLDDGCNVDTEAPLDSPAQDPKSPDLAVGNGNVAVVWSGTVLENDSPVPRGFDRIFGELLCE